MYKHQLDPSPMSANYPGYTPLYKYQGKDTHCLLLYKYGPHWALNHWETQTYDEELLNGSEKCLDWHYKQLTGSDPNWKSEMLCTMSTKLSTYGEYKPTTTLTLLKPDSQYPKANYYLDEACGMLWWLCPMWGQMHPNGEAPKKSYLMLTPTE